VEKSKLNFYLVKLILEKCHKISVANKPVTELARFIDEARKIDGHQLNFKALERAREGTKTTAIGPLVIDSTGKFSMKLAEQVQKQLELLDVAISEAREKEKGNG
jgi:hypothetical protein